MAVVRSVSKEFAMTESTGFVRFRKLSTKKGSFGFQEIGTVPSFAGGTPFTVAGTIFVIVMVVPPFAVVAEAGGVNEPWELIAAVVVTVFLDQSSGLVGGYRSRVDDHVRWVDGHDFDVISRECCLKLLELGNSAGSYGNVR